jgi:ferredoxin-NADP reductase/DMSO/TMAO reductase YedYZ heme-binding membrane subunit
VADSLVRPADASRIWVVGFSAAAMLSLVALMAQGDDPRVGQGQADAVWWYAARASGLLAWLLLSASVVAGLLSGTQLARGRRNSSAQTQGLHQFVGTLAVVFTAIHLASVLAADQLRIGLRELLVPFARPDNPVAQGAGVLAFYLLVAIALTSWLRALLSWRWWRSVHLLAFPLWGLASVHSMLAGSDSTNSIVDKAPSAVAVVILFLAVLRLLTARPAGQPTGRRRHLRLAGPRHLRPAGPRHRQVTVPTGLGQTPSPAPFGTPTPLGSQPQLATPAVVDPAVGAGMRLVIGQTTWEADNVLSVRLVSPDGVALPSWEPGAHIELVLPSGRRRQYSLCGDPNDTRSYRIAVLQLPAGRGGSMEVHASARVGQLMTVQGPRNHFPLVSSPAYLFIAGGIGITAVLAMAARVAAAGGKWNLVYAGRRRTSMAFLDEVRALGTDRVDVVPGDERGRPDLDAIIGAALPGTAVYCCGPDRMLHAVRERVAARPDLSLHVERFTGAASGGGAFQVELNRTGRVIDVPADRTVLQAVRDVLPSVAYGCEQGLCGGCRTTVLAGEPDHRDELLGNADRAAGAMLICVSRARTERLLLDL